MFQTCKQISALEAAQRLGLTLKPKGRRFWTCCPLHSEKTPSMMFDEKGWHCFGCHKGGDAVALYAEFFNERPYQAAKRLLSDFGLNCEKPMRRMPKKHFRQMELEAEQNEEHRLLLTRHTASQAKYFSTEDAFWDMLQTETDTDIALMNIDAAIHP